jgi:hypothetical protein
LSLDCSKSYPLGAAGAWESISSVSLPMIGVMSYHYSPLSPVDNEMGIPPHPGFMPSYTVPSQQLSSLTMVDPHNPPPLGPGHDMNMNGVYSAGSSVSLHHSETDDQQQPPAGNSGEKKRNKLGYHRTSVACGKLRSTTI